MSRQEPIARAFLRYLYEDNHFRPEVAGFFDSARASALSPPPTWEELGEVVRTLREHELIATSDADSRGVPVRAGLTGSGLICAGHHGGDVNAWARSARAVAVLDDPEVPEQAGAEPVIADRPSFAGLARVARVVLLTLPTVHARYGETVEIERTARELCEVTQQERPDPRRVRLLARGLRATLTTGTVANTLGVVLLDGLDEAMQEAGVT